MSKSLCAALIAVFILAGGPAAALPRVVSEGPAVQYGATQFVIHSERLGRDFLIKVTPPFAPVPKGETRPVIYVLDGGYELAGPVGWMLGGSGAMAQAYIVSVSQMPTEFALRDGDLNFKPYVQDGRETPARGALFEAFLLDELEPFIAARFPADPTRAYLFGHSAGGLFGAEVFAAHPDAFQGYILASPGLRHDPDILVRVAQASRTTKGARIFLAVGGAEPQPQRDDEAHLAAALSLPGARVTLARRTYESATHLSYYPRLVVDAFPWLLPAAKPQ
jgi:predicted alpha/beta superfamily hydrolase